MVNLFNRTYQKQELLKRVGDITQVGGVYLSQLLDGAARGVRVAEFRTGGGLRFTVLLDRGMDIGPADFGGWPLAWVSSTGAVHPAYYEPQGYGFLRTFHGGLLTGCGLTYVGHPTIDEGQELGLHGRLSHIPASHVAYGGHWEGDEYLMWVEGRVRESAVFGVNLVLTRRISTWLGGRALFVEDVITNEGWEPAPFEMLYHCNFGFPVVSAHTKLLLNAEKTWSRDASKGLRDFDRFQDPTPGYTEHVLDHIPKADKEGYGHAALVNQELAFGAYIKFRLAELPRMLEWKMMGEGLYVVGLEPTNCTALGRNKDRELGSLRMLQPGEQVQHKIEIGVLPDAAAITEYEQSILS